MLESDRDSEKKEQVGVEKEKRRGERGYEIELFLTEKKIRGIWTDLKAKENSNRNKKCRIGKRKKVAAAEAQHMNIEENVKPLMGGGEVEV